MRLKLVELQGYKTFASRTEFSLDSGITAIVGPNGSGKSNIADAIRWVLGEQSYRALRGKRTEDMIFAGSTQRSRLGMASASLVLDNTAGWLPIDFSEVQITRRAFRSGENEYLLNGRRVRLRDITELLSKSGLAQRTYTVIGQGLVDAVLSLRAEDRRALFEEAAGIALYNAKRSDALARMEETRTNLLRVSDIIQEIAPRLARLEQAAEQAERHALLSQQLEGLLRTWYGYRWRLTQLSLRRARDAQKRREERLGRSREALDRLDTRLAFLRTRQSQLREQLGNWHRESSGLHRQMESVQKDLAVWQERDRLLSRRSDELQHELSDLEVLAQSTVGRVELAGSAVEAAEAEQREKAALVETLESELHQYESLRDELTRKLTEAQNRLSDLSAQTAERRSRLAQIADRISGLAGERSAHRQAIAGQESALAELRSQADDILREQRLLQAEGETLEAEAGRLDASLSESLADQTERQAVCSDARRDLERLKTRTELLNRWHQDGEGVSAGVKALLRASNAEEQSGGTQIRGIVGTVAQLLRVPPEIENAIEVALAGHLQDIVVESWTDARAAISFLHETKSGRATLLPLDTMRPGPRLSVPGGSGFVGIAAGLVEAETRLAPVVESLLGRTLIVEDLDAARRAFSELRGGFRIVTLSGDMLHSSGSVTGGLGPGFDGGLILARERERRELPSRMEESQRRIHEADATLAKAMATERNIRTLISTLGERRRTQAEQLADTRSRAAETEKAIALASRQISWRQELVTQLDQEEIELEGLESSLRAEASATDAERAAVERQLQDIRLRLDAQRGDVLYRRLSEAHTSEAVAAGACEHRRATWNSLRESLAGLRSQIEDKRKRMDSLAAERSTLAEHINTAVTREVVIKSWLSSLTQKIEPAETEVVRLESERDELAQEETAARTRLREAESRHAQAVLAVGQEEDRLHRLRRQIMDDFGLVEMEPMEGVPDQPPLPMVGMVSAVHGVESLPEGLEDEIHHIRAQINRMGSINPNAPAEYAEAKQRSDFLTEQAADLEEAAGRLRAVIAELDEVIHREFERAFQAAAARFSDNFTELFAGGRARLVLTEPDDLSHTGVEILARPPGKRQQTLAMLSGGERALTAAALIFALLETSPPPFCILDEVDAMLDEANIRRFRQMLERLSVETQMIVITHSRGTVEAANTIYGISMGDDSVSQVVSLRLDGDALVLHDA